MKTFLYSTDKAIQSYIEELPYDLRSIFLSVRDMILINLPFITEKLKFDVPFYYLNDKKLLYLICYSDRVVLGFCEGSNIEDRYNLFNNFTAKGHRQIEFYNLKDSYNSKVIHYLQDSMAYHTNNSLSSNLIKSVV